MLPAVVAGIRPVDLPFEVFVLGDDTGVALSHALLPLAHIAVDIRAVEPHAHRRHGGPEVGMAVIGAVVKVFVMAFNGKLMKLEQMKNARIGLFQPEHDLH